MEKGCSSKVWGRMGGYRGVYVCGLLRSIRMGWEEFSKNIRFEVGVELSFGQINGVGILHFN